MAVFLFTKSIRNFASPQFQWPGLPEFLKEKAKHRQKEPRIKQDVFLAEIVEKLEFSVEIMQQYGLSTTCMFMISQILRYFSSFSVLLTVYKNGIWRHHFPFLDTHICTTADGWIVPVHINPRSVNVIKVYDDLTGCFNSGPIKVFLNYPMTTI